ncbi:MAG: hypothetical protein ABSA94_03715 [Acidobacteriaceae bacterium]|jgi:hypothetical protein
MSKSSQELLRAIRTVSIFAVFAAATLGSALAATSPVSAMDEPPQAQPTPKPKSAQQNGAPKAPPARVNPGPSADELERWRQAIVHTRRPSKACFTAKYPATAWTEVPCVQPPNTPFLPARGLRPQTVGNGLDFSADPASGLISQADGLFDKVTGVTSEYMLLNGKQSPNVFSLQLNTQTFTTSACGQNSSCTGWQQFIFSNGGCGNPPKACAYIQSWLFGFGTPCPPSGWISAFGACMVNSSAVTLVPVTLDQLASTKLTGQAAGAGGSDDTVTLTVGATIYSAPGDDHIPDLGQHWQTAEFNIFGNGDLSEAVFNSGSTLVVRTVVDSGTTSPPTCDETGFTGETNNLTLTGTTLLPLPNAPVNLLVDNNATHIPIGYYPGSPLGPSLVFTESNVTGVVQADCADALTIGDTHLSTFSGLHYDFQASGDFVLLTAPEFSVHARQVSGAPTWPNASVNKAIVTQMGATRVEIYVEPERLYIDGRLANLADRQTQLLPTGVQVVHHGSEYDITSASGNAVRATLYGAFIDATIGLGKTPSQARGLLGTPGASALELVTADGAVLKEPVSFSDLYNKFGESWRVPVEKTLFTEVTKAIAANPSKPLFAQDLTPAQKAHALAACKAAGIVNQDLLNDCTLDTTVLHDDAAVKVFTTVHEPIHVLRPVTEARPAAQ